MHTFAAAHDGHHVFAFIFNSKAIFQLAFGVSDFSLQHAVGAKIGKFILHDFAFWTFVGAYLPCQQQVNYFDRSMQIRLYFGLSHFCNRLYPCFLLK